jgi:hypothetical protein
MFLNADFGMEFRGIRVQVKIVFYLNPEPLPLLVQNAALP